MIIENVPTKQNNARGMSASVIRYFFELDDKCRGKTIETVKFVGTSSSLCVPNPIKSFLSDNNDDVDLSDLIRAFELIETKNIRCKKPFEHIVLSLREGEVLTSSQWNQLINDYVKAMGFIDHNWVAVNHLNTLNNHCHLLISRISNSAPHKVHSDSFNFKKSALVRSDLELKYDLLSDNNPFLGDTCKQVNNAHFKTRVQAVRNAIDSVLKNNNSLSLDEFTSLLSKQGVGCYVQFRDKSVIGMSYTLGGYKLKASKLGAGYKYQDLCKAGVTYDEQRHHENVKELNELEVKLTDIISNGFEVSNSKTSNELNAHYLLVPNEAVSQFPLSKSLHKYSLFNFWLPVNTVGKTKQQIESEILQMKLIRTLLSAYFAWLNSSKVNNQFCSGMKFENRQIGFSKVVTLDEAKVRHLVKQPQNFELLNKHDCLLISKQKFLKLSGNQSEPIKNTSSTASMSML